MSEPNTAVFHKRTLANRALTMLAAARPAFLTASVLPVLASGALSSSLSQTPIAMGLLALSCLNIVLIHSGANVLNDYFDALNGTDDLNKDRIFPFSGGSRFIQNNVLSIAETGWLGFVLLAAGGIMGLAMSWFVGPILLILGVAGGLVAFFYSAPPCLSCRGLGDLAVAVCFGVLPVVGTSLILGGQIPAPAWWLGAIIGCFVAAILWANSVPDIAADRQAGKWTLPARIGPPAARRALPLWFAAGFVLLVASPLPRAAWIALLAIVPAAMASKAALENRLESALPLTILTHACVGLLLIVGLGVPW